MTPEAKQLLIDKPELCKEIYLAGFQKWWVGDRGHSEKHLKQSFDDLVKEHTAKDWEILEIKEYGVLYSRTNEKQSFYENTDNKLGRWIDADYAEQKIKRGEISIHSVRRLSDNEVFTVGEEVGLKDSNTKGKIASIKLFSNYREHIGDMRPYFGGENHEFGAYIQDLTKRTPLFITEDGVEYFKGGGTLWEVYGGNKGCIADVPETAIHYLMQELEIGKRLAFSTREAAEQWVEDHKPRYSKKQLLDIANKNYATDIRKELKKLFES